MTRKDYIKLARAFNASFKQVANLPEVEERKIAELTVELVMFHIADTLKADNPNFQHARFKDACKGVI